VHVSAVIILFLMLSAWSTGAVSAAIGLPQCTIKATPTSVQLEAIDHGRGMTSFIKSIGPENGKVASYLYVTSCHTGGYVRATIFLEKLSKTGKSLERQEFPAAIGTLSASHGREAVVTLGGFYDEMKAASVPVIRQISRYETCACAEAYPGLRGTKWSFQGQ